MSPGRRRAITPPRPAPRIFIGWHVNRDWDHAPDFFPVSRFRDQFNRPDIVNRMLDDLDEDKAITEANRLAGAKPAEKIEKAATGDCHSVAWRRRRFLMRQPTIRYSLRSPSGLPISELTALVDGRPLSPGPPPERLTPVTSDTEPTRDPHRPAAA